MHLPELPLLCGTQGCTCGDLAVRVRAEGVEFVDDAHLAIEALPRELLDHGVHQSAEGALEVGPLDEGDGRVRRTELGGPVEDDSLRLVGVETRVEGVFAVLFGFAGLHLSEQELGCGNTGFARAMFRGALRDADRRLGARGEQFTDLRGPLTSFPWRERGGVDLLDGDLRRGAPIRLRGGTGHVGALAAAAASGGEQGEHQGRPPEQSHRAAKLSPTSRAALASLSSRARGGRHQGDGSLPPTQAPMPGG